MGAKQHSFDGRSETGVPPVPGGAVRTFLQTVRLFSVLLLALACSACSPRVTDANLREVNPDMTTKEVESILGAPTRVESAPELISHEVKTLPVTRYVYEQNGEKIELLFIGDKLGSGSNVSGSSVSISSGVFKKSTSPAITGTFSK